MFSREELEKLKTPCFIFDKNALIENFNDFSFSLENEWSKNSRVAYSVKTNPFPWILKCARECGCMAEVVSDAEYDLALKCGFAPKDIIFNGPIKTRPWFEYAIEQGSLVNIDSHDEVDWLEDMARTSVATIKIGIRVNIDLDKFCPRETVNGPEKGRFGYSYEGGTLAKTIERLKKYSAIEIAGLHMHVTTLSRSLRVYKVLASHAAQIINEFELAEHLEYVDMGGGYFGGGPLNKGKYGEYARIMAEQLRGTCDPDKINLYVEPGGAVVCTPGYYLGRVRDVKDIQDKRFVVSELSRLNIDHEMKKTSYVMDAYCARDTKYPEQVLCGFTCMESDRMCKLVDETELSRGDLLLIKNAGAYSMCFTPGFFIEYAPSVYVYENGIFESKREGFSQLPPCNNVFK